MSDFVLGVGQQNSLRKILAAFDKELFKTMGKARRLCIAGHGMSVTAEREKLEGDFDSVEIRLDIEEHPPEELRKTLTELEDICLYSEDETTLTIQCPKNGAADLEKVQEAIDQLSASLTLPEVWRGHGEKFRSDRISSELIFQALAQYKASDVHLAPGLPPLFRSDSEIHQSEIIPNLSSEQILTLIQELAQEEYWQEFERIKQTSFSFHQRGLGYARVSAFIKQGAPHCTLRYLPETIPSFEDLHVPGNTMEELAALHRGLVLVTGMTGSGKTTTSAALIDWINAHKSLHIITIENPVEYIHRNKRSVISQRNLGADVNSFNDAVTGALRHDPDVIMIGEMRDPDTIRAAINAAATGHLVVSTLHANTAAEVVNRIVSFFDPVERDLVRLQLRDCLQCVICQRLVPKIGGGRVPALEFLFNDIKPMADGITIGNTDLIRIAMQQGISHSIIFERYLHTLYKEGIIDLEHAQEYATEQSIFDQMRMGTYSVPRLDTIKGSGVHEMFKS